MIDVDAEIEQFFEQNLRTLEADRGHALAPAVREAALSQVKMYYRRLSDIAERVTDTEVKLILDGQTTPEGRPFIIEGVVDIVREKDRVILYDIKTHAVADIHSNLDQYEKQLNVYAYIWQILRRQKLDETAVISTRYPSTVEEALVSQDEERLARALKDWEPVIPVPFSEDGLNDVIGEFGGVVDGIERHEFAPPSVEELNRALPGMKSRFAVAVCRNCDVRFSCRSYRQYMRINAKQSEAAFMKYIDDLGDQLEQDAFVSAALDASPNEIDFAP